MVQGATWKASPTASLTGSCTQLGQVMSTPKEDQPHCHWKTPQPERVAASAMMSKYFPFVPGSSHTVPKPLGICGVRGVSFVCKYNDWWSFRVGWLLVTQSPESQRPGKGGG